MVVTRSLALALFPRPIAPYVQQCGQSLCLEERSSSLLIVKVAAVILARETKLQILNGRCWHVRVRKAAGCCWCWGRSQRFCFYCAVPSGYHRPISAIHFFRVPRLLHTLLLPIYWHHDDHPVFRSPPEKDKSVCDGSNTNHM